MAGLQPSCALHGVSLSINLKLMQIHVRIVGAPQISLVSREEESDGGVFIKVWPDYLVQTEMH